jgi:hypothetical protein
LQRAGKMVGCRSPPLRGVASPARPLPRCCWRGPGQPSTESGGERDRARHPERGVEAGDGCDPGASPRSAPCLGQEGEQLDGQQLVTDAACDRFDVGVLPPGAGSMYALPARLKRHQSRRALAVSSGPLSPSTSANRGCQSDSPIAMSPRVPAGSTKDRRPARSSARGACRTAYAQSSGVWMLLLPGS